MEKKTKLASGPLKRLHKIHKALAACLVSIFSTFHAPTSSPSTSLTSIFTQSAEYIRSVYSQQNAQPYLGIGFIQTQQLIHPIHKFSRNPISYSTSDIPPEYSFTYKYHVGLEVFGCSQASTRIQKTQQYDSHRKGFTRRRTSCSCPREDDGTESKVPSWRLCCFNGERTTGVEHHGP